MSIWSHCPQCPDNFQRQTFLGEKNDSSKAHFRHFFAFQLEKEEWWHGISTTMVSVEVAIKCCHGRFLSVSGFQKERRHAQISINITPHKRSRFCAPLKWCVHNFKNAIIQNNQFFVWPYPVIHFDTSLRNTILKLIGQRKKNAIPTNGGRRLRSLWETPAALIALCLWHPRHRPPLTDSMKKSSLKLSTSLMIIKSTVAIKQAMSMIQSTEV